MTELSLYAVADLAVGGAFMLSGLLVWRRGRARLSAALLGLAGGSWFLGNLAGLPGFAGAMAAGATYLHRGPLVHLVLTLPNGTATLAGGHWPLSSSGTPWPRSRRWPAARPSSWPWPPAWSR